MDTFIECTFRFLLYTGSGLCMETCFAVAGIEKVCGCPIPRRVPRKYLEGFVSLYMVPLHGLGLLFLFEPGHDLIREWHFVARFGVYAVGITSMEVLWGFACDKVLGFYSWDYYAKSPYRMFERGYTLWTLVPFWGIAGMILETYSDLMIHLSPHVAAFFGR